MRIATYLCGLLLSAPAFCMPQFKPSTPVLDSHFEFNSQHLCVTAKNTLDYLNKGAAYDPAVIHSGRIAPLPLERIKATLSFVCAHQAQMHDPNFIKQHFEFVRWYPDTQRAKQLSAHKSLLQHLPQDRILMTKYYVHLAKATTHATNATPYPLYALPADESSLSLEQANAIPSLTRFKYGKQAILKGALKNLAVPIAYLSREDLESALLQGTVVAEFADSQRRAIFNVHRNNNIAYDRTKTPYAQERFWYFKQVDGIKGYGKDAEHKITVVPEVTFAADITQFGLGKLLMVQYPDKQGARVSKIGVFADTGGAFADNLYQVDYLVGSYPGKEAYTKAVHTLPDYVDAYFMVVKPGVH